MNTKLHAVTDTSGRPIQFFITAGKVSDYTGAAALLSSLPDAQWLLADRGYDANWFREALIDRDITPCIPGRKSRSKIIKYDKRRYKRRNRIERMFGRLKDWRRISTRYDGCGECDSPASRCDTIFVCLMRATDFFALGIVETGWGIVHRLKFRCRRVA